MIGLKIEQLIYGNFLKNLKKNDEIDENTNKNE
jgi:hypothetical protein